MIKTKRIIAGLGVVAGLGTSLLPLTSAFALNENEGTAQVNLTITSKISLTIDSGTVSKTMSGHTYNDEASSTLKVTSNTPGYILTAIDNTANGQGELVKTGGAFGDADNIKPITDGTAPTAESGTWGLKVDGNWFGLPANGGTAKTLITKASGAVVEDTTVVNYGFGTGNKPVGTYSATILYTAVEQSS